MKVKIKGKVYKTIVRPAMVCGAETWAAKKAHEKKMKVAEMKMSRWMCGVTRLDKIRNEKIRGSTKVEEISKKVQERRMRWYGHVMRIDEEYVGKRAMGIEVQGSRRRGRPKKTWADCVKADLREKELSGEQVYDRAAWRRLSSHIDITYKWNKCACGNWFRSSYKYAMFSLWLYTEVSFTKHPPHNGVPN